MDAGVVSGPLHSAPLPERCQSFHAFSVGGAGKVPATLRATAARS